MNVLKNCLMIAAASVLAATAPAAFGEPPSAEDILLGSNTSALSSPAPDPGGDIAIRQTGDSNVAAALQRDLAEGLSSISATQSGEGNLSVFHQTGADNHATTRQDGEGNLTLSQQVGAGNVLVSNQTGDYLGLIVRQYGGSAISVTQSAQ